MMEWCQGGWGCGGSDRSKRMVSRWVGSDRSNCLTSWCHCGESDRSKFMVTMGDEAVDSEYCKT